MEKGIKTIPKSEAVAGNLQAYYQLVELQKQMIQLAQQNERVERECAELRKHVAAESLPRRDSRQNLRQKAGRALRKLPGVRAAKSNLVALVRREPSPC